MLEINFWAVLTAAISAMVIGFIWYGPLFGKPWARMMGFTQEKMDEAKKKGMTKTYVLNFIAALVEAYVLAEFTAASGVWGVGGAFAIAFWLWLGFIATVMLGSVLFEMKPVKVYFINISYQLVTLFVMALIFIYW